MVSIYWPSFQILYSRTDVCSFLLIHLRILFNSHLPRYDQSINIHLGLPVIISRRWWKPDCSTIPHPVIYDWQDGRSAATTQRLCLSPNEIRISWNLLFMFGLQHDAVFFSKGVQTFVSPDWGSWAELIGWYGPMQRDGNLELWWVLNDDSDRPSVSKSYYY